MKEFKPLINRDASHVINGYVYQVNLTIERWICLGRSQVLELECGEDIDTDLFSSLLNDIERIRTLEQVKHRESSITFRNPNVVKAIACFVEHRRSNPELNLVFRYTTNSNISCERPPLFEDRKPALEIWENIRRGQISKQKEDESLRILKVFLINISRPKGLSKDIWDVFREFITTTEIDGLRNIVKTFEWSTGCASAIDMQDRIKQLLKEKSKADSDNDAQAKYERLFLHVFKTICKPDVKRLTCEDLEQQLTLPTLVEADSNVIENIKKCLDSLDSLKLRTSKLESNVKTNRYNIDMIFASLAEKKGISADIQYGILNPIIDIPPLVDNLSNRNKTTKEIHSRLSNVTWLAMNGGSGIGKTQLAVLVAREHGNCKAWIGFRGKEKLSFAAAYLNRCLEECVQNIPTGDIALWYQDVCSNLGDGSLIVLDDLPKIQGSDDFSVCLHKLAKSCEVYGIKLLSTGIGIIPATVMNSLKTNTFANIVVPPFDKDETKEIFEAYGADAKRAKEISSFVNNLTQGHPALIVAMARYLREKKWMFSQEELIILTKHDYATGLKAETIRRLLDTVEDENCRELLYRLNLATYLFDREDIKFVSAVQPAIDKPFEKLEVLDGLWVQKESEAFYTVSPLIKVLGSDDIPKNRQRNVSYALGLRVINKKHLNQWDAQSAVVYFLKAEAHTDTIILLITFLTSLLEAKSNINDTFLPYIWSNNELPNQINLNMRIYLRCLQIRVFEKLKRDNNFLVDDIEKLIQQTKSEHCWSLFGAAIHIFQSPITFSKKPELVNHIILKALKFLPVVTLPDGTKLDSIFPRAEQILWITLSTILTPDKMISWALALSELSEEVLKKAFESEESDESCMLLSNAFWPEEGDKPKEIQNWDKIISAFSKLEEQAAKLNQKLLWVCARRAQMIILAEYRDDFDGAIKIAKETLEKCNDDPRFRFIVNMFIGNEYFYTKQYKLSHPYLKKALCEKTDIYPAGRIRTYLNLSVIEAEENKQKSIRRLKKALKIAKNNRLIIEQDVIRILGELSIAKWQDSNDISLVFPDFEEAGERLLSCREETINWKALFVSYGHVAGFFHSIASSGEKPKTTLDGSKYTEPFRTMFYAPLVKERAALFKENSICLLMSLLAAFAEKVNEEKRAAYWALRSWDVSRASNYPHVLGSLAGQLIPYLLKDRKYGEVLDIAIDGACSLVATKILRNNGQYCLETNYDTKEILGIKPNKNWDEAEHSTAILALLSATFHILSIALSDHELAKHDAEEVASLCVEISSSASMPEFWSLASELFSNAFCDETMGSQIMKKVQYCDKLGYSILAAIGYFLISFKQDRNIKYKAYTHIAAMPYVFKIYQSENIVYRSIIIPFLSNYWSNTIENSTFLFSTPGVVKNEYREALTTPIDIRAQRILKVITQGLGLKLTADGKSWLEGNPNPASQSTPRETRG